MQNVQIRNKLTASEKGLLWIVKKRNDESTCGSITQETSKNSDQKRKKKETSTTQLGEQDTRQMMSIEIGSNQTPQAGAQEIQKSGNASESKCMESLAPIMTQCSNHKDSLAQYVSQQRQMIGAEEGFTLTTATRPGSLEGYCAYHAITALGNLKTQLSDLSLQSNIFQEKRMLISKPVHVWIRYELVALQTGRKFIGAELKESYFNVAINNLDSMDQGVRQQSLFG